MIRAIPCAVLALEPLSVHLPTSNDVITNRLVGGALTAMKWVTKREWTAQNVGSFAEAVEGSFAALEAAGKSRPSSLDASTTYLAPSVAS